MTLDTESLRHGLTSYVHLRANEESFDRVVTSHLDEDATYDDLRFNMHRSNPQVMACGAEKVFFMYATGTGGYNELHLDNIIVQPDGTCNALTAGTSGSYLHMQYVMGRFYEIDGDYINKLHKPVRLNVNGTMMYVSKVEYWCHRTTHKPEALHIVYFLDPVKADATTDTPEKGEPTMSDEQQQPTHGQRLPVEELRAGHHISILERIGATTTREFEDELQGIFNLCNSDSVECKFYDHDGWPLRCVRRYADFDGDGDVSEYTFVMERCTGFEGPEWFELEDLKNQIHKLCDSSMDEDVEFRFVVNNRNHVNNKLHILYMYYEDENPVWDSGDGFGGNDDHRLIVRNCIKFVLQP